MSTTLDPSEKANEVKLGQVREFTGIDGKTKSMGLVFRLWMEDDEPDEDGNDCSIWLVCPVKPLIRDGNSELDPTGVAVYAQPTMMSSVFGPRGWDGGYALPCIGGSKDAYLIERAPIVGHVIPETVEQCWRLFRWPITGEKPDPEREFHYFESEHSKQDWDLARIVLADPDFYKKYPPMDMDTGEWVEDERLDKLAAMYDGRDEWGPCCSECPWFGQSHKPCAKCERLKAG